MNAPSGWVLRPPLWCIYSDTPRLLVTVDYAETRPELVAALLRRLRRRRVPAASRVVLVVRQRADRQALIDLFATGDAREEIAGLLRRAEWVGLGVGERELDHLALFHAATTAFTTLTTSRERRPPIATTTRICAPSISPGHCSFSPPPCSPPKTPCWIRAG